MRIKFAQSSRRHRIGKSHMAHVMATSVPLEALRESGEQGFDWIGLDDRGIELHISAVVTSDDRTGETILLVVHCMPTALRNRNV